MLLLGKGKGQFEVFLAHVKGAGSVCATEAAEELHMDQGNISKWLSDERLFYLDHREGKRLFYGLVETRGDTPT